MEVIIFILSLFKAFQLLVKYKKAKVTSDSLQPHGLCGPWNSPGQITGVGSLSLLQGILPTQGSNPGLPHCKQMLYQLSHKGSQRMHRSVKAVVPNLNGTRCEFLRNNFSMDWVVLRVLWG